MPSRVLALSLLIPTLSSAEGTAETGPEQTLRADTEVYVDIVDHTMETVTLSGVGDADLYDPKGAFVTVVSAGQSFGMSMDGTYQLVFHDDQTDWDIHVSGATGGRVWSYAWQFNSSDFSEANSLNTSFFAAVPSGGSDSESEAVIELVATGVSGFVYTISGNALGVDGGDGRSLPTSFDTTWDQDIPLYLNAPEATSYSHVDPVVADARYGAGLQDCDTASPGAVTGQVTFDAQNAGAYHFVCDGNLDGLFDLTSPGDVHILGRSETGENALSWDGVDNNGIALSAGTYDCVVMATSGEFHYLASDIETAFVGLRMFYLDADRQRWGLPMFWNDQAVQGNAAPMPDGALSLSSSGSLGLSSGAYAAAATANVNARSWGNFSVRSKGNQAVLDTYTWISSDTSDVFSIVVADPTADTDGDGLSDATERCEHGTREDVADTDKDGLSDALEINVLRTDPLRADTDDDGVMDGDEASGRNGAPDSDGDGLPDAVDIDDDGDGIPTALESTGDTDGDGLPDFLDPDDDGDAVGTRLEGLYDTDEDGIPDHLDADDDNDGVPTRVEGLLDSDGDGFSNCRDTDDDGDNVPTASEFGDTDGDGIDDFLDTDDDGDGHETIDEGSKTDTDGDGLWDYLDSDDDGDTVLTLKETGDTDSDRIPDHLDADDDGDGLDTADEIGADFDGDGLDDAYDADDDNDGIVTAQEFAWPDSDVDGDGQSNWLDLDSDGDGIPDETEGSGDSDKDGIPNFLDPIEDEPTEGEESDERLPQIPRDLHVDPVDGGDVTGSREHEDADVQGVSTHGVETQESGAGCSTTGRHGTSLWLLALFGLLARRRF
jgi:hypothetical protein